MIRRQNPAFEGKLTTSKYAKLAKQHVTLSHKSARRPE
jgi:CRISPR/Cas system-associated endoribonuclease Cas2